MRAHAFWQNKKGKKKKKGLFEKLCNLSNSLSLLGTQEISPRLTKMKNTHTLKNIHVHSICIKFEVLYGILESIQYHL